VIYICPFVCHAAIIMVIISFILTNSRESSSQGVAISLVKT
jgi:hypothetical protein